MIDIRQFLTDLAQISYRGLILGANAKFEAILWIRGQYYLLTNWLAYLYGRIQSPRPDVMPDQREGITRVAGFVFACIDTQTS